MIKRIITLFVLCTPTAFAEIPTNEYVKMDATAKMGPQESRTDDVEPDFRAFSSMEATDDGRIIYWGGGHGNYGGNDMDVYHVADNEWRQETQEENWKEDIDSWDHLGKDGQPTKEEVKRVYGSGPVAYYLTGRGRPGTRHVYQQATWWPEKGWFVFDYKHSLWAWNPEQGDENGSFMKIHDGNANQGYADIHFWNIRYDPPSGSLVSFNTADDSVYRLKDGKWQKVMDVPFGGNKGETYSEFHEADGVHYAARWQNIYVVDMESETVEEIPDNPPQVSNNNIWMEYSPEREQMLVMGFVDGVLGVWGYNPDAQEWEDVNVTGDVIRPDGNPITNDDIRWDMLERDPVSGNYYFLSFRKGAGYQSPDMYAFRLAKDAGQSAPSDPSPHPENQWVTLPIPSNPGGLPNGTGKDFQIEWREATGNLIACCGDWAQKDGTKSNGNEHVYSIDPARNDWEILVEPCNGEPQPEGWDELAVAIREDELWGFPGFSWDTACETDINAEAMALDLSTGEWRTTGHGHLYTHDDTGFGGYDPVTDLFWSAERPGINSIDPNDPEAGLTTYNDGNDYHTSTNQMFLDVQGRVAYLTGNERQQLIRFDLESHDFQPIADIPDGAKTSNAWAVWDSNHRVILAPPGSTDGSKEASGVVYVYHVDLAKWQRIEYPNDGTVPFGNSVGYDVDSELLVQMGTKSWPEFQSIFALEYDPETTGEIEPWVEISTEPEPSPEPEPEPEPEPKKEIALTGGKYHVVVDGETVSTHYVSKEALEEATTQVSNGAVNVKITRDETTFEGDAVPVGLTGGMYHLVVDGEVVSDHRQEKEALQEAVNAALAGKTNIKITRDVVRVEMK